MQRWIAQHAGKVIEVMGAKVTQAHPDFVKAFLASLPAKQRMAGLDPEQIASVVSALPAADRQKIAAHLMPSARTRARKVARIRAALAEPP